MSGIVVLRSVEEFRTWRRALPSGTRVGFVPTMGALHEGHLSLVKLSRDRTDVTVASIFINPLQFGPKEDLAKYPRPFEKDLELLRKAGVAALFAPEASGFYAPDASTYVVEEQVSQPLCGEFRTGHFRGVATVVLKLFNVVQPQFAFFGQKDAQQCSVIERMVRDLDVPVKIVRGPTLREADGLAMSSRNIYLSREEREKAPRIHQSLRTALEAYLAGERDPARLEAVGREFLEKDSAFRIQYWEVRDAGSLNRFARLPDPCDSEEPRILFAVAAFLGSTRLIDNLLV